MGTWRMYTNTDASAPVLTGQAGSLVALLDAVLVDGYGSKAAAGWSQAFSPSGDKRVYRPGAASTARMYYRVLDDATNEGLGTRAGRQSNVRGYESMSDIDTGTGPFPTVSQATNGASLDKSQSADATAREWVALADDRTLVLAVRINSHWQFHYLGEIFSYTAGDAYHAMIIGGGPIGQLPDSAVTSRFATLIRSPAQNSVSFETLVEEAPQSGEHFIARPYTQAGTSQMCGKIVATRIAITNSSYPTWGAGILPQVNPADGGVYLSEFLVTTPPWIVRGKLRGLWFGMHRADTWLNLDEFDGTGDLAGKRFMFLKTRPRRTNFGSPVEHPILVALEISDTVPAT